MSPDDWALLVKRINGLWPPAMSADAIGAYFDILEPLPADQVRAAIDAVARTDREHRPRAGALYELVQGRRLTPGQPALSAAPNRDVLRLDEHRLAMAQLARRQTPEHQRRTAAVHAAGLRLSFVELSELLPESACPPGEFDRRLATHVRRRTAETVTA